MGCEGEGGASCLHLGDGVRVTVRHREVYKDLSQPRLTTNDRDNTRRRRGGEGEGRVHVLYP